MNFSDRIWTNSAAMKADLDRLITTGLIRGKNLRVLAREMKKHVIGGEGVAGAKYHAERLMRTELARVQTEAQKQSMEENGFELYQFFVNGGCCSACEEVPKKKTKYGTGVYRIKDLQPGLNAAPIHPNCRCSIAPYEDSDEYKAWLDFVSNGGTSEEWEKIKKGKKTVAKTSKTNIINTTDITDNNVKAIYDYMSAKSYVVNDKLRNNSELSDNEQEFIKELDTALEKLPKYNGNLQRSLYFNSDDDIIEFLKDYTIGKPVTYKEYISTTKGEIYNPDGQVQIYIKNAKNGVDISSYNKAEDEVLYNRDSTFKASNIVEKYGKHYILLEEEEDE